MRLDRFENAYVMCEEQRIGGNDQGIGMALGASLQGMLEFLDRPHLQGLKVKPELLCRKLDDLPIT